MGKTTPPKPCDACAKRPAFVQVGARALCAECALAEPGLGFGRENRNNEERDRGNDDE